MSNGKGRKILLVDDEEHLLVTLRDFLTFEGFEVYLARSGEEALERLGNMTPELIILDISMPGIGGLGFLRKASTNRRPLQCPVLVLTARSNMREFFDDMDVAGFLAKPCTKEDLLRQMNRILSRHASRKSEEPHHSHRHVLLGEDDPKMSAHLEQRLAASGFEVTVAETGPRVLELAPQKHPDIVVLKGVLTKMNGDAVASLLKAMPSTNDIPVILYDPDRQAHSSRKLPTAVDRFVPSSEAAALLGAMDECLTD